MSEGDLMKPVRVILAVVTASVLLLPAHTAAGQLLSHGEQSQRIIGSWKGTLEVGGAQLRLLFHVSSTDGTKLTGTLDSPDQGVTGIPLSAVILDGDSVAFPVTSIGGLFEGLLQQGDSSIGGTWKQSGMSFPLRLRRSESAEPVRRPQNPEKPYPYREEEITFQNTDAAITLAGTLTIPSGPGSYPAAILISGSGAQDRDETVFGHKPFLVLSDYLTRKGIAVLRYDDRGVGGSTGDRVSTTSKDYAGDVLAGVRYLRQRSEIDRERVGLIGHSEGGIIAPMVATMSTDVAFIVLMAGTGLTGDRVIIQQVELIGRASGTPETQLEKNRKVNETIFAIVQREPDKDICKQQVRRVLEQFVADMNDAERKRLGDPEKFIDSQVQAVTTPWARFFLKYDPRPALEQVTCPVLAVTGEKDLQVAPEENLAEIDRALRRGGNSDVTVKMLPGLNHLFQTAETGNIAEYSMIEETISPVALDMISEWILSRFSAPGTH
jgi:pimeloyl-ACP methyl ester carboxylesterase